MTLKQYWKALNCHDWFYYFSDDPRFNARQADNRKLERLAMTSDAHGALFRGFRAWAYSGQAWGTPKQSKPQEPSE